MPSVKTDPIAHTGMQVYIDQLLHEQYAPTCGKEVTSLKKMRKANPNSPTRVNFMAMVKWAEVDAVRKIRADIGLNAPAE